MCRFSDVQIVFCLQFQMLLLIKLQSVFVVTYHNKQFYIIKHLMNHLFDKEKREGARNIYRFYFFVFVDFITYPVYLLDDYAQINLQIPSPYTYLNQTTSCYYLTLNFSTLQRQICDFSSHYVQTKQDRQFGLTLHLYIFSSIGLSITLGIFRSDLIKRATVKL